MDGVTRTDLHQDTLTVISVAAREGLHEFAIDAFERIADTVEL